MKLQKAKPTGRRRNHQGPIGKKTLGDNVRLGMPLRERLRLFVAARNEERPVAPGFGSNASDVERRHEGVLDDIGGFPGVFERLVRVRIQRKALFREVIAAAVQVLHRHPSATENRDVPNPAPEAVDRLAARSATCPRPQPRRILLPPTKAVARRIGLERPRGRIIARHGMPPGARTHSPKYIACRALRSTT